MRPVASNLVHSSIYPLAEALGAVEFDFIFDLKASVCH